MAINHQMIATNIQQQGLATRQTLVLEDPVTLESGQVLTEVAVAYHTYGSLNDEGSNAMLLCHALTGDAFVAGKDEENSIKGWWDDLVGPEKPFDTDKFFIICTNALGSCQGTTGPASFNPATDQPWGMTFPVVTIKDMVKVQRLLLDNLRVKHLKLVAGGSIGGMQVLEWGIMYPDMVDHLIPIATSARLSPMAIAYNDVGRKAITMDSQWKEGDYYPEQGPTQGLALARMLATITYKSDQSFTQRFGRNIAIPTQDLFSHDSYFEVESYLRYQGEKLTKRFDANSYLYLQKAMDLHDISRGWGSVNQALERIKSKVLLVGISSDAIYPTNEQRQLVTTLHRLNKEVAYLELDSPHGHDAFLIEFEQLARGLNKYLAKW